MTVTAQYLDSVNVPPPGTWAELWAPVGLRYHALHHLLPSVPYHAYPEAHRRLSKELGAESTYRGANSSGAVATRGKVGAGDVGSAVVFFAICHSTHSAGHPNCLELLSIAELRFMNSRTFNRGQKGI